MTEVLYGLDRTARERVAALRAEGRFFWLDVSLSQTSREDLVDALAIHERAPGALRSILGAYAPRAFHADGESVAFALRCYVELATEEEHQAGYRLRPIEVQVVVTSDYLLTLHDERVSLPAALAPDVPPERSKPIRRLFGPRRNGRHRLRRARRGRTEAGRPCRERGRRGTAEACRGRCCGRPVPGSRR